MVRKGILTLLYILLAASVGAQELQVKVNINSSQVEGTDKSVFENLQQTLEQWMNDKQWTELQFQKDERINVNFNITVQKYDKANNRFECSAMIQANRPVYNSAYTTTLYNNKDGDFNFDFAQFDQLNFMEENIDNQLTALMAYYAFLIIGLDLDSFGPMAGTEVLQRWMQYDYYRKGLDEMSNNAERGRTNISEALELLKQAHQDKPLSLLPQIWTDYKRDELANIYKGKGTQKEKENVYNILFNLNASQSEAWNKIKE